MEISYSFEYLEEVVKNDITQIPRNIRDIIKRAIEERLGVDPFSFGKPLRYSWKGHKSLRVGGYRIIYRIKETEKIILIVAIKHRKEAYIQNN
jgi:addiction module RelE/StbE family toxin